MAKVDCADKDLQAGKMNISQFEARASATGGQTAICQPFAMFPPLDQIYASYRSFISIRKFVTCSLTRICNHPLKMPKNEPHAAKKGAYSK
jgi:hypothetical protein